MKFDLKGDCSRLEPPLRASEEGKKSSLLNGLARPLRLPNEIEKPKISRKRTRAPAVIVWISFSRQAFFKRLCSSLFPPNRLVACNCAGQSGKQCEYANVSVPMWSVTMCRLQRRSPGGLQVNSIHRLDFIEHLHNHRDNFFSLIVSRFTITATGIRYENLRRLQYCIL